MGEMEVETSVKARSFNDTTDPSLASTDTDPEHIEDSPSCRCGCIPPDLMSLFQMAALRSKYREKMRKAAAIEVYDHPHPDQDHPHDHPDHDHPHDHPDHDHPHDHPDHDQPHDHPDHDHPHDHPDQGHPHPHVHVSTAIGP